MAEKRAHLPTTARTLIGHTRCFLGLPRRHERCSESIVVEVEALIQTEHLIERKGANDSRGVHARTVQYFGKGRCVGRQALVA